MKDEKEDVISMMSCKAILLAALIFFIPQGLAAQMDEAASDELVVFAAASLTGAFGEIGDIYETGRIWTWPSTSTALRLCELR